MARDKPLDSENTKPKFPAPKVPEFVHEDMTTVKDLTEEEIKQVKASIEKIKEEAKYESATAEDEEDEEE